MHKRLFIDTETDGIKYTKIWCACTFDPDTNESKDFHINNNFNGFIDYIKDYDEIIGHNFIGFDRYVLKEFFNYSTPLKKITDTLTLSKMFNPELEGGHSMEAWGQRIGTFKKEHEDWSKFTPDMLERCRTDVQLNYKIHSYLTHQLQRFSKESVRSEHIVAHLIDQQNRNGVYMDEQKISVLHAEITEKKLGLEKRFNEYFKQVPVLIKEVHPKYNKDGSMSIRNLKLLVTKETIDIVGGPFSLIEWQNFNLNSPKQVIDRVSKYGWNPTEKTKGHIDFLKKLGRRKPNIEEKEKLERYKKYGWVISEENLATISDTAPEIVRSIKDWKILYTRLNLFESQWQPNIGEDGRLRGYCDALGAVTNRMTHNSPNLANIPAIQTKTIDDVETILYGYEGFYSYEVRSCFTIKDKKNYRMVGTDASGLELRMLAHFMGDEEYINYATNKIKDEDGKTIKVHEYNRRLAELKSIKDAKRFIYGFLYGAGDGKIGQIVGGTALDGKNLKNVFLNNLPYLKNLIEKIKLQAQKGYITGLDGRLIRVRKHHAALNTLLQSGGAIVCKYWLIFINQLATRKGLDFTLLLSVHDEYQFEVHINDIEEFKKICKQAINMVAERLKLKVSLDCDVKVGLNWAETH